MDVLSSLGAPLPVDALVDVGELADHLGDHRMDVVAHLCGV
jgi:hypothetical protein